MRPAQAGQLVNAVDLPLFAAQVRQYGKRADGRQHVHKEIKEHAADPVELGNGLDGV